MSVWVWDRIATDESGDIANVFSTAPDWTIEILSPDRRHTKAVKNIMHCLHHGATLGWLIDPDVGVGFGERHGDRLRKSPTRFYCVFPTNLSIDRIIIQRK